MTEDFDSAWATITDVPPAAHQLKFALADRWVRLYSLPDGKRYADTAAEHAEVLHRSSTAITDLAGDSQQVVLATGLWGRPQDPPPLSRDQKEVHSAPQYWREVNVSEDDTLHVWASLESDLEGLLPRLVTRTADYKLAEVLLIFPTNGTVAHPYDGGLDLIMPTPPMRDDIANKYSDWISTHESGF